MRTVLTSRGHGSYVAPAIETIEVVAEHGFAGSNPGGGVEPMSYDTNGYDE